MQNNPYDYTSADDPLESIFLVLLVLFILVVVRNWYNLYRKRSFRKKNRRLTEQLKIVQMDIENLTIQSGKVASLESKLAFSQTGMEQLGREMEDYKQKFYSTLSQKEQEIEDQKTVINHQRMAYERYVNFKNVETNNTRLGAHFIKNVINQIYIDLDKAKSNHKSFLGIYYSFKKKENKIPSLKSLKQIFQLLDYNVSALNREHISLEEEWLHINMFMELIQYLKPKTKVELKNMLSSDQKRHIKIKPTLFFPFVENALKHGSLNENESFITITLKQTEQNQLIYSLINSSDYRIDNQSELDHNTGQFGLNALQQLLDAYYPNSILNHRALPNNQYLSELTLTIN